MAVCFCPQSQRMENRRSSKKKVKYRSRRTAIFQIYLFVLHIPHCVPTEKQTLAQPPKTKGKEKRCNKRHTFDVCAVCVCVLGRGEAEKKRAPTQKRTRASSSFNLLHSRIQHRHYSIRSNGSWRSLAKDVHKWERG